MKIEIPGAAGFLRSHRAQRLLDSRHVVIGQLHLIVRIPDAFEGSDAIKPWRAGFL